MDARHVNKTKKTLEVERLTWRFDLNRSRSFFTLTLVNFDWPYTHTHTQKKTNLEKCPCTWEKKKTFEKKFTKKKGTNELAVFSHGAMHSQWVEAEETENFFIYIIYTSIYIWIYLHHLAIGSVGDPFQSRKQPIFFFSPLFLPLTLRIYFHWFFSFFLPCPLFFLCYNIVILFNSPLMTS